MADAHLFCPWSPRDLPGQFLHQDRQSGFLATLVERRITIGREVRSEWRLQNDINKPASGCISSERRSDVNPGISWEFKHVRESYDGSPKFLSRTPHQFQSRRLLEGESRWIFGSAAIGP